MSSTTTAAPTASRTPLLAAIGIAGSALITAVGTFWDLNNNDSGSDNSFSEWIVVIGILVVAAAVVFGLVVRTAADGNPGRRSAILGVVAALSIAVFWAGLPLVLASASLACALTERDQRGSFGAGSKTGLVLSALTAVGAVLLAIYG